MQLGHSAAWDQDWERAIEFYRKALAESPEHPVALTSLGLALLQNDRVQEALAVYEQAGQASPEDPIPLEKCAEIYEKLGESAKAVRRRHEAAERYIRRHDAEKAVENWVHIARITPEKLNVRSRLALAYERMGRRKEAVQEYLAVASIMQHSKKQESALEAAQRALNLVPGDPEASKVLRLLRERQPLPPPSPPAGSTWPLRPGKAQARMAPDAAGRGLVEAEVESEDGSSDPEEAAQARALSLLAELLFEEPSSDNGKEEGSLGMAAISQGQSRKDRQAAARPSMFRYLGQAIDLHSRGHLDQASREFTHALEAGLDHPAAHFMLGTYARQNGDVKAARTHLNAARNHPELALGANLALGRLHKDAGDLSESAQALVQALRIADTLSVEAADSSELNQLYDTVLASQDEGDEEALKAIVDSALEFLTGPKWLERIRRAREQLRGQQDARVVPIVEMLAVGGSDKMVEAVGRIDNLVELGLLSTAMEEAMLALSYAPTYLGLHRRMAELMVKSGRPEAAITKLNTIAETHLIRGEAQPAVEVYRRILRLAPVDLRARQQLIRLMIQQDLIEQAVGQYLELAEIYRQMAQIEKAREALAQALQVSHRGGAESKWTLRILNQIGDIDMSRLDWRRALESFGQMLELDPENEQARFNVIDLNLRLGQEDHAAAALDAHLRGLVQRKKGAEALELLEQLVREHPGKQILHARLAEAYRAAGRKADAIAQYDALGEIQLDAGQVTDAITSIETIISMEPPDVEGYEELLRNLRAGQ